MCSGSDSTRSLKNVVSFPLDVIHVSLAVVLGFIAGIPSNPVLSRPVSLSGFVGGKLTEYGAIQFLCNKE